MEEFLRAVTSFPTIVFTVLVGLVLAYWGMTLALTLLGLGDHDHNGIPDFLEPPVSGHGADSGMHSLLDGLGLGSVPLTLLLSLLAAWGWFLSLTGSVLLGQPQGPTALGIGLGAFALALIPAGWMARRIAVPDPPAPRTDRRSFVGRVGKVHMWTEGAGTGVVRIAVSGPDLLLRVRLGEQHEGHALKRGDEVLLFDYDPEKDLFSVAPVKSRALSR